MRKNKTRNRQGYTSVIFVLYLSLASMLLVGCENGKKTADTEKVKTGVEIAYDTTKQYPVKEGFIYIVNGEKLVPKLVQYIEAGSNNVYQGDIIIKTSQNLGTIARDTSIGIAPPSISTYGALWTNRTIFYVVDPALTPAQKKDIKDAIGYWMTTTNLLFVMSNTETNHVYFKPDPSGPSSNAIGMKGGRQVVNISPTTSLGNVKHEIGHVAGLWHEQARDDRDKFITVNYANIKAGAESQFAKQNGIINTVYDYSSIMHYPKDAFSKNGQPTIVPKVAAPLMGQRDYLSALDLAGLKLMYP